MKFEEEARIEGAKRPRIEGEAPTDNNGRGRSPSSEALTAGEGRGRSQSSEAITEGEAQVKAPLRGLPGRQYHPGNAGYPS